MRSAVAGALVGLLVAGTGCASCEDKSTPPVPVPPASASQPGLLGARRHVPFRHQISASGRAAGAESGGIPDGGVDG
jgi:hypothetical protein